MFGTFFEESTFAGLVLKRNEYRPSEKVLIRKIFKMKSRFNLILHSLFMYVKSHREGGKDAPPISNFCKKYDKVMVLKTW